MHFARSARRGVRGDKQRRALLIALALSLVLHAVLLIALAPLFGHRVTSPAALETVRISRISIVRLVPRSAPARVLQTPAPRIVHQQATQTAITVPHRAPEPQPAPHRRSRVEPPRVRHVAHAVAQERAITAPAAGDTAAYQATIAKLRAENDPVAGARTAVGTPGPASEYRPNVGAEMGVQWSAGGILEPVRAWKDGGYDYYYVHYWVRYADGSTESGVVPWPLRYLPGADPFRHGITRTPLPGPLPDYVLASGTTLQPLLAYCYEHHLALCPIEHD